MTMPVQAQLQVILESVLLGAAMGLAYDILRAVRWHYRLGLAGTALCDALFWLLALAAFFRFGVALAAGQNRYYVLAGMAVGAGIYMSSVSSVILEGLEFVLSGLAFIYRLLVNTVIRVEKWVRGLGIPEKIQSFRKKVWPTPFHFWPKRYKIKDKSVSLRRRQREWRR